MTASFARDICSARMQIGARKCVDGWMIVMHVESRVSARCVQASCACFHVASVRVSVRKRERERERERALRGRLSGFERMGALALSMICMQ